MLDGFYGISATVLYPLIIILIAGGALFGVSLGHRHASISRERPDTATLTGASLGLLALMLGFTFSWALARYDARRSMILEEANAIGSTANFALMLPEQAQRPILDLLRKYTAVRTGLGVPFSPPKFDRDIQQSLDLQAALWQQAVAITATSPQSLPAYRFVASLNEMNNIHERRLTAMRNHVPSPVMVMLVGLAMVAMGYTGFHAGRAGVRVSVSTLVMSVAVAVVIMLVIDLDRPTRGFITVSVQPLIDAAQGLPR